MVNVVISSCGIGFGHAARDEAIYDSLKKKFSIKILSYGEGHRFLKKNKISAIKVPGILYERGKYSLDIFTEVLMKLASLRKISKGYFRFAKMMNRLKPDIILTDLEPYAFFYAYRRDIPVIAVSNVVTTLNNYDGLPASVKTNSLALQRFMLEQFIGFMRNRGAVFIEPVFDGRKKEKNVINSDLFVRKKPEDVTPINFGREFFYISVGSDMEKNLIKKLLSVLPKFEDKFFVIVSDLVKKKQSGRNFMMLPFVKDPFPYIKACSGVIAPAGHTTISEALVYGKPLLIAPMKDHIEQLVNAHLVQKEGFGAACYDFRDLHGAIRKFFANLPKYRSAIVKRKFKGNGADAVVKLVAKLLK